jgi:nucleoside-diphosphate-sugar epimerase
MSSASLVLVTGATGAVGPIVVEAFLSAGFLVRTLSLDQAPANALTNSVDKQIGDICDKAAVQRAMNGVDTVVHLAALLHRFNPTPAIREQYERINVWGTKAVVDAAIAARVQRIVFSSTIAVYGASNGRILNEDTPVHPDTLYAQSKHKAERIVLDAQASDGNRIGCVLRFGSVYGARIKGNYERLVRSLNRGSFVPIGNGANRRTLIYDKDVARALVLASAGPNAAGRLFNVSDGEFYTVNYIIKTICSALDRKIPFFSLPVGPVRFIAGIIDSLAGKMGCQSRNYRGIVDKYIEDTAVESKLIKNELEFVPQYGLSEGWRDAIKEMRQSGALQSEKDV